MPGDRWQEAETRRILGADARRGSSSFDDHRVGVTRSASSETIAPSAPKTLCALIATLVAMSSSFVNEFTVNEAAMS